MEQAQPSEHEAPDPVQDVTPTLPAPDALERNVLGDWVTYSRMSHQRLKNADSPYAEFMGDMLEIVSGILEFEEKP